MFQNFIYIYTMYILNLVLIASDELTFFFLKIIYFKLGEVKLIIIIMQLFRHH
jgi:hypothetical protein